VSDLTSIPPTGEKGKLFGKRRAKKELQPGLKGAGKEGERGDSVTWDKEFWQKGLALGEPKKPLKLMVLKTQRMDMKKVLAERIKRISNGRSVAFPQWKRKSRNEESRSGEFDHKIINQDNNTVDDCEIKEYGRGLIIRARLELRQLEEENGEKPRSNSEVARLRRGRLDT